MTSVKITESKIDLFLVPQSYALAHSVESSLNAIKGTLAWQFELIYGDVDELRKRQVESGNVAVLEQNGRFVYFLVTKENLYHASSYDNVQAALICMREHMRNHEVTKVAMPRICCDKDGLEWKRVKQIIQQVFANEHYVEILVCTYINTENLNPACEISEIKGEVFNAPEKYALVHSVSADFAMCAGINLQSRCRFNTVDELKRQNKHTGNVAVLEQDGRYVYNLITKERSHEKCTYTALYYALIAMRDHMREHGVSKLAIPRLGCGIDRMDWHRVRDLLELIFVKDNVHIIAFFYEPPNLVQDALTITCPTCHHIKVMRIPRSTHSSRLSLYKEKSPF